MVKVQQLSEKPTAVHTQLQIHPEMPTVQLKALEEVFVPVHDFYLDFLFAFFQIAVETNRLDLVEKFAKNCGNNRVGDLARSLPTTPLPSILGFLRAKPHHYSQDLPSLLQKFYYNHRNDFPYCLFQFAETNHSSWILHGLATICDIGIRILCWDGRIEKLIYPNTDTRRVLWLYLFKDFTWSSYYPSPCVFLLPSDRNLWPMLRDLQSLNHLPTMREFGQHTELWQTREVDLVLSKALHHLRNQLSCAICFQSSFLLSPCIHGFCDFCLAQNQHYSCPVCPAPCFLPVECSNSTILTNQCCAHCWKAFPLAGSNYPGDPLVQLLHQLPACGHVCCSFCIETRLRSLDQHCPICPAPLPIGIDQASTVQMVCPVCKEPNEWIANFELAVCRDHRICSLCMGQVETTKCPICFQPFLASTSPSALNLSTIRCSHCRLLTCNSGLYRSRFCRCEVCVSCLCESDYIQVCGHCGRGREGGEVLEVYFFVVNRWKEVREWKKAVAEDNTGLAS